jgi:diketogulonate reductase-like aldo/keto reductase
MDEFTSKTAKNQQNASVIPTLRLNNGVLIPQLGLGVFLAGRGAKTEQAVLWALEAGYRHIDTAAVYGNEAEVGRALKASGLPRQELFITGKTLHSRNLSL